MQQHLPNLFQILDLHVPGVLQEVQKNKNLIGIFWDWGVQSILNLAQKYVNVCVSACIPFSPGLQVTNQAAAPEVRPPTRVDVDTMPPPPPTWPTQSPATCSWYETVGNTWHSSSAASPCMCCTEEQDYFQWSSLEVIVTYKLRRSHDTQWLYCQVK